MVLPTDQQLQRRVRVVLSLVICGAFIGLLVGTRGTVEPAWTPSTMAREVTPVAGDIPPAVVYSNMNAKTRGPNRNYRRQLSSLVSRIPDLTNTVVNTESALSSTLVQRANRRAYEGAPPVIPHPVIDNDTRSCYACHGGGLEIGGRIAPRISHKRFLNCTQCHAPVSNPGIGPAFPVENEFVGMGTPGHGTRAWDGAPPTIPHSTQMRENCTSCHGLLGREGIRTPHPWRMNCTQCHAGNAEAEGFLFTVEGKLGTPVLP